MTRSTRHRTARARRHLADRVRARPRLEGLEDRRLLSVTITEFPVPTASANLTGITAGPDGHLWFVETNANKIGEINPTTHAISEFAIPTTKSTKNVEPFWITAGPDGNLWFTEFYTSEIGMISPTTHAISQFPTPSGGGPEGVTTGPDGNLWFTEGPGYKIGEINPATHAISEFPIPTAGAYPEGITAGPDGNLWFGEAKDVIGMINPTTHTISQFALPISAGPVGITAGPDGNLWFTEQTSNIGMINPATDAITEYPVPYANSASWRITGGPDGNLWFTDRGTNAIGVVTLDPTSSTHLVITQPPPASVTAGTGFGLTVQAEDSSGHLVSSFDGTVKVGLASNPGGTTLGGTLTVAASGGVATSTALVATSTNTTPDPLLTPLVLDSPDLWEGLGFKRRSRRA